MFGHRHEGKAIHKCIDPITRVVPYIMTTRADSQCYCTQFIDSETLVSYVRKKRIDGHRVSQMAVVIAAYVRMISQMPELNRFVVGKKVYARKELCVSFAMVKILSKTEFLETTLKIYFDPSDTVFDVARKVDDAIQRNKHKEASNKTDKVVNTLLSIPGLLLVGTGILKLMDRYGIMPRMVVDASPFHTSMFITNMASIRLSKLHHHLYNFGTTTVFLGMGKREPQLTVKKDGTMGYRDVYPLAVTTDERVCAGAFYGMAFQELDKYLKNPELLEVPPESVRYDENIEYHLKKDKIH